VTVPADGTPAWLTRLFDVLRGARLPVAGILATDDALDIDIAGVAGQAIKLELRPGDGPGHFYAMVGRRKLSYRAADELHPTNKKLLAAMVTVLGKLDAHLPLDHRGIDGVGSLQLEPAEVLHKRFPFAWIERSTVGDRTETEVLARVTPQCNQSCPFCSAPPHPTATHQEVLDLLDSIGATFPGARVTMTGGEPTLRPTFDDEVRAALQHTEISWVQVQTNAVTFSLAKRAAAWPADARLHFFVSLHATEEALYDRCTGTSGQFPKAIQGIRNLLGAGHRVVLNAVASSLNYLHLEDLLASLPQLFAGLPLPSFHFSVLMCPDGRDEAPDFLVRYSELAPALQRAVQRANAAGIEVEPLVSSTHASIPLCLVGEEHRRASTHRPRLTPGETGYEDFSRRWTKAAACRTCCATEQCLGLPSPYAQRFGLRELKPY